MDDIQKLIEEHGLTPVPKTNPQIDSLVNQFGLVPAQTEGGYGVGTFAKDVTKNVAAGAIPGVLGAPEAIQAAANQQVRTSQAVPTDIVNMLANPQALTNKFVESLGFKPIFREEDKTLIPEEMTKKQNMAMDEVLSKGKIPQLKSLSELGNKLGQNISQTVSPEMQLAMANFVPTGSLDDIAHGRLEKISLGAKPSMLGLAGQFSNVFGSVMPGMIGTLVTKDPRYMEAFGFGQAGSEAIGNARQYIQSLDDNQLSNNSPYFQELLRAGYDSKTARMMTEEKAADTAAAAEGVVGMLGGNFTANLITGKFDKALISSVRNRALNIAAKTAKGAVTGATEEGLQEMSEGIASDLGINKTVAKEIGADAFSNLILGAIGGGGPGAVSGARAKSEEQKVQEEEKKTILQEGKNVTVEGAPLVTPKKSATITEEELSTTFEKKVPEANTANLSPEDKKTWNDLLLESKKLTAEHLNNYDTISPERIEEIKQEIAANDAKMAELEAKPPYKAPKEAKKVEEAEIPSAKPGFDQWRTEKGITFGSKEEYEAALPRLRQEYEAEMAGTTAPKEIAPTEVTPKKPIFTKSPNDPAIEAEGLAIADEIEKLGNKQFAEGMRGSIKNLGGFTNSEKLDFYKQKLLEAQQKAGTANEKVQETFNIDNYLPTSNKAEIKRFKDFLPNAPEDVKATFQKSNQYLQDLTDKINELGYKVLDVDPRAPAEVRNLKSIIDGIAGSTFRYAKDAEHIAKNNRFASPENMAKTANTLANDFAEADKLLGTSVEEPKKVDTVSFDVPGEKGSTDYYLYPDGKFTRIDDVNGEKQELTFVTKNGGPEWVPNNKIQNLEIVKVNKDLATSIIAKEKDFIEKAKQVAEIQAKSKEVKKTQAEINRERQAKQKAKREEKNAADRADFERRKAEQEEEQKKPEVKAKTIEKIKKNMVRFASGMSGLSDLIHGSFTRAKHQNYGVGFDVGLLSKNAIKELAHFVVNMDTQVFVDSGAFSHFRKQLKGQDVGELDFDKILAKYDAITDAIAEENAAEKQDYPRPLFVMPDVVGDQKASLDLVKKYAKWIDTEITFNQSKPIIPIQKGELTLSEAFRQIMDDLNTNKFIVGIPSNESAVSRQDLIEFLRESRPHYVHFLGAAADSKINPLIDLVATYSPGTDVTADASKVRSAILNGVAKGKTRAEAIKDALYEEEDPLVVLNTFGKEEPIKVEKIEPIKEVEGKVSKEYQTALNKSRKASKAFASAQDGYRKRLINDEEFLAARKRYDESMAEYDIAYAKEQEKPEPKEVKVTPKKTAPVSSEEDQLIQDAVLFAKAANRTNLDEAKIRDTVENARIKDPATVIDKLKGSVENLKNQAKDNLIRLAAEDYREQVGGFIGKDSELVNAIKGGALNIEGKEYAPAFYKAYNIDPAKIKKPTVGNAVDAQVVKFESGIFVPGDISKADYVEAATKFLESPLTAKMPTKTQGKIDLEDIKDVTPLPIEKKIAVKNKTYEDQKAALADITAAEDIRYYLKGVKLDKDKSRMMATDGHRGANINDANFDGAPETTKGNDIVAKDNSIIEGQFPDMDRVMPKSHTGQAQTINTKDLGDYARGIQKAWRYVDSKINPITIKHGQKEYYFNSDYVIDMANVFAKMGYDKFQLSVNKNDMMYATSPDNKVQQVLMAMKNSFSPFVTYGEKAGKKVAKVEAKAEPKAGVAVDDEGEKLSFPLFVDMANKGYKILGFDNPRTYETKGGKKYRTIEKDGVRLALNPGEVVFADPKYPNRSPMLGYGESNQVTWHFIGVDQDQRKQGKATQAIKDLMEVADKNGYTVYGEPAQLEKEGMTAQELSKFYSKFGFSPSEVSEKVIVRNPQIADESRTIDVEATEITEEQIMLLTDQTDKLSKKEMDTLENYYGFDSSSSEFFKMLREDIVRYINKGAEAVDITIRDIIKKLQSGVLAVAMVFNPAYMSQQSAVVYPTKTVTEEVRAMVPDSAKEMSDSGKKAYAALQPALQSSDKFFTIVDKPTSKVFVFQPDGSLLVKDNVVLGMAMGDTYVGGTDFKANRITPAGLMKVKAEKGSGTYDGKTIYTVGNVKEGWNTAFMHTVYLKESDAAARKAALATGEGARLSHGCVNASPEVMAKIGEDNRMDGSHVFVVPDNQAKTDDYIANNVSNEDLTRETVKPITKTTQVPEKPTKPELVAREEKAVEQKTQAQINQERQQAKLAAAKVADEGTFFNNFDADFNKGDFEEGLMGVRDEQIKWQSYLSRQLTATMKDIANYGSDLGIQAKLNYLREAKQEVKTALNNSKEERRGVDWFVARAAEAKAEKQLSPEAKAVVDTLAAKYPSILSGLKLSVVQSKKAGVAGNFRPFERLVTIYHSSYSPIFNPKSGERQAVTMRHEISHSLEQLMTPQAQMALVEAWASSLDKAIKKYPGEAEQAFFQKVLDFVEHPTEANMKRATNAMPDISFYQYVNPSEFWAVNAEKLMKSQLGTPWARFVKAVQKLWEAIKSVFGFDNRYAIHREFDRIMKGDQQQMTQTMLADYLKQNGEEITFLNNVEDIDDFMDTYDRPDAPLHYSPSVMDRLLGGKKAVKELSRKMKENPMLPVNNMVSNVGRGVLYTRVKNVWFGAGLDEADRVKYEGQARDAEGHAVASIAVTNALHGGHVGTQVMILGKLMFDPVTQMFRAVKDKFSLANVVQIKNKLEKRIGAQRAANLIQAYFEAKRSRSIVNEYLGRTAELTKLLEEQMDPSTSDERQLKLNKLIADAQEDVKNIQRALDKVNMDDDQIDEAIAFEDEYPELREMMDNWTSVNQNMIDNMEFSGIISKKRAETLRNIKDYVPWYRIQDDATDVHSAQGVRTLTNVGREKTFKEGTTELEIDDIVDNMIHNVMMLTRNSMRNYAANRVAMEYAERNDKGKLQVYPTENREKGIFNILAGGRRINIKIADPLIAESVLGLENIEIPMGNILRFFANGLRWSVTINPIFQAKQLFMDAPTAALVTGVKHPFRLWAGAFGGFIRGLKPHDPIVDLLKSYGIGGYRSAARSPEHELKQEIGVLNKNYFDKAVSILDHISDASDYAQRVAVYKRVLAETGDQMQAIVQANNVIDFQKKGSGQTAQLLTRTVSFMNAYAQQIDVLAQALSGKGLKGLKRQQAFARLVYTGGLLASVSLLYCMAVGDDDEYQKMDDQTKMRNFVIPKSLTSTIGMDHAVMLPMSTSAAFFFKAVPEMLYNKIVNEGTKNQVDNTRLRNALAKAAADSLLGPTPFPTGLKPFAEIGLNYNFFTGGTITPKGMEKLDPSRQYTNTTSELGKIFSKLSGGVLNPIQADHLMRSLGGTVAATAMWGSNLFSGNRPDAEAKANPLYGSFIAADVPRGREDLFYDLQERADRANETFKDLSKKQHPTEAKQWFEENKQLIIASGFTTGAATSLKSINAEIRRLSDLPAEKMSAEEKRQKITFYKNKKNDILEQTIAFRLKAGL